MKCKATWFWSQEGFQIITKTEKDESIVITIPSGSIKFTIDDLVLPYGNGEIVKSKTKKPVDLLEKIWK